MMPLAPILTAPMPGQSDNVAELEKYVSRETVIRSNEPLARRTTLRVGGPADLYAEPASDEDLGAILKFCLACSIPCFVLGRGSNLLVRDGGFRGVIICLAHSHFSRIEIAGNSIRCGAGARLKHVAIEAKARGLAGFEFLEGIPGSLGGALRMNAGAMDGAIFDLVQWVRVMDRDGTIRSLSIGEVSIGYRNCPTLKTQIALAAELKGKPDAPEAIARRMGEFSRKRWSSQPAAPSAGCIFKNPPSLPAGKLIDELGLKGARVGGAVVSAEHGNFIINDGSANARDVLQLISLIQERARSARGIELQTEVEIVGDEI